MSWILFWMKWNEKHKVRANIFVLNCCYCVRALIYDLLNIGLNFGTIYIVFFPFFFLNYFDKFIVFQQHHCCWTNKANAVRLFLFRNCFSDEFIYCHLQRGNELSVGYFDCCFVFFVHFARLYLFFIQAIRLVLNWLEFVS